MNKFIFASLFLVFMNNTLMAMNIFVRTVTGQTLNIDCELSDTIDQIKAKIQDQKGIMPEEQTLIFTGNILEDGLTLSDYNIHSNSILELRYKVLYLPTNQTSLKSFSGLITNSIKTSDLVLHGIHGHPLDMRKEVNQNNCLWISGDLSNSSYDEGIDYVRLGEVGGCLYSHGSTQITLSLGKNRSRENTVLNGYQKIDGTYTALEAMTSLEDINQNLWLTFTMYYNLANATVQRGYFDGDNNTIANGNTDIKTFATRVRLDFENIINFNVFEFTPFLEIANYHSNIDAYRETTSSYPVNFDRQSKNISELHVGMNSKLSVTPKTALLFGLEKNYIFHESKMEITGTLDDGTAFKYDIDKQKNNWYKATLGMNIKLENSRLNFYYNWTSSGQAMKNWVGINWIFSF